MWWNSFLNYAEDHEAPHADTEETQQQQQQQHQKEEEDEQQQSFAGSYSQQSKSPKWHLCIMYVYSINCTSILQQIHVAPMNNATLSNYTDRENHASSFFITSMKNSLVTVMRLMCIAYNDKVFSLIVKPNLAPCSGSIGGNQELMSQWRNAQHLTLRSHQNCKLKFGSFWTYDIRGVKS